MNKQEARALLAQELARLRAKSYEELDELIGEPRVVEREGPSGAAYTIETEVVREAGPSGQAAVRVITSIDDGGFFSTLLPLTADFIMRADGTVADEAPGQGTA